MKRTLLSLLMLGLFGIGALALTGCRVEGDVGSSSSIELPQ
jgi:hypothetical protein